MYLESLLKYYQDELEFLVEEGKNFAKLYPSLAKTLDFSSFSSNDPDIQRLIESTAFLNAKLQKRLDENAPEVSNAILNAVYPQFESPIPSFMIVNFSNISTPNTYSKFIPKNTTLTSTKSYDGQHYTFKTTMDTHVSSYEIQDIALIKTASANLPYAIYAICDNALQISLINTLKENPKTPTPPVELTFYLHTIDEIANHIYEALFSVFPNKNTPIFENGEQIGEIEAVGFNDNENLLPIQKRENGAYRLLLEYNVFPKKFLFFKAKFTINPKQNITIPFNSKKSIFIKKGDLLLNCCPAINLFERNSEPTTISQKKTNYEISANYGKGNLGIYTILNIIDTNFNKKTKYVSYFSSEHILNQDNHYVFWIPKRAKDDFGISISLLDTEPTLEQKVLYAQLLCFQTDANSFVDNEETWIVEKIGQGINCINLDKPTPTQMPVQDSRTQWRLISHLAINYFGFENNETLEHIKELFAIYDFNNTRNKNPIHDLQKLEYHTKMTAYNEGLVPLVQIELRADDNQSSETFLLANILHHFFAQNLDFNTKMEFILKKNSNGSIWKKWKTI